MLKHILRLKNTALLLRSTNLTFINANQIAAITINQLRNFAQEATDAAAKVNDKNDMKLPKKSRNPFSTPRPVSNFEEQQPTEYLSDDEREKRLQVLKLEADIAHQEGRRVPSLDLFKDEHWNRILGYQTKSQRYKYYGYLWQVQMKKLAKENKKAIKTEEIKKRREEYKTQNAENNHIIYGLTHTTMFLRIYETTMNHMLNNKLIRAMQFDPKIVLDCSYDQYMTHQEAFNTAKQLMLCFAENRFHDEPFDLHYCNVNLNSVCMKSLKRYIPTMLNMDFPMNVHENCFTELFPKENLVYLTPHCRHDLIEYNPDDIYIIGAMVDKTNTEPISLAKAKKLGLRMARLPLDRYLQWNAGSGKSLTLNQMISIMLDQKKTKDWNISMRHVPRRKLTNLEYQPNVQKNKLKKRAEELNFNIRNIFDDNDDENSGTAPNSKIRSRKEGMQFNLETWGKKNK